MVGEWVAIGVDKIADRLRLCSGRDLDAAAGEPIEPCRNIAADPTGRPEDKREAPFGHPIAKVCVLFDALDVIVQRTGSDLVESFVFEAARFQCCE